MPDYDFHQLSPLDFEHLARDLMQAEEGVLIETFKTGKDGGVDFRYAHGPSRMIGQCKHYVRTGLDGLLRAVGKEAPKLAALNPARYVFVTSVELSDHNIQTIRQLIGPHILAEGDVWGRARLNNLLDLHPSVEARHFKLWLASRGVLDRVLNSDVAAQSEFAVMKVHKEITRYVQSEAYRRALEMLEKQRLVVISGAPGVGKTTLANMLLYHHLEQGYQPIVIKRDISEGQRLLQRGVKQLFHFDDFMGATFLGDRGSPLERNGDRAITDFIEMVQATPDTRLIVTTRQHILAQAFTVSERLRQSTISRHKVVVAIGQYTLRQRAEILYNHIHFSALPQEYRDVLLADNFYLEIVKHSKFNPRLIDWLSNYERVQAHPVGTYRDFVRRLLADPSEIWWHAYHYQLSDAGRSLMLALFSHGGRIGVALLQQSFEKLHRTRAKRNGFTVKPEDYANAVAELANAFIRPTGTMAVEVIDPSVMDLMNKVVADGPQNVVDIMAGAGVVSQIEQVWGFVTRVGRKAIPTIKAEVAQIAENIGTVLMADRRHEHAGAVAFFQLTFEKRLELLLTIQDAVRSPLLAALISPLFERMEREWTEDAADVVGAADLIRRLNILTAQGWTGLEVMGGKVRRAALDEARTGCPSDQLRELTQALDIEEDQEAHALLAEGFTHYRDRYFSSELRETNTMQGYEELILDLSQFQEILGVNTQDLVNAVETARVEFEEGIGEHDDFQDDVYKERWREERSSERDVHEMFGSLKGD